MSEKLVNFAEALKDDDLLFYTSLEKGFYRKVADQWKGNRMWRKGFIINDLDWMNELLHKALQRDGYCVTDESIPFATPAIIDYVQNIKPSISQGNRTFLTSLRQRVTEHNTVELVSIVTRYVYRTLFSLNAISHPSSLAYATDEKLTSDELTLLLDELTHQQVRGMVSGLYSTTDDYIERVLIQTMVRTIAFLVKSGDFRKLKESYSENIINRAFTLASPFPLISLTSLEKQESHGVSIRKNEQVNLNVYGGGRRLLKSSAEDVVFPATPGVAETPLLAILLEGLVEALPSDIQLSTQVADSANHKYESFTVCIPE